MGAFVQTVLWLTAAVAALLGVQGMVFGSSAVHQILTAVYFLIFTVAIAGIGMISAARRPPERIATVATPTADQPSGMGGALDRLGSTDPVWLTSRGPPPAG